jgi:monoamine oxidase
MEKHEVLVIGAGAAGLAAARRLLDGGYDTLVLEAGKRVGGRIETDYQFAHHPVELGAEFVHGENVVTWDLIRTHGLGTTEMFAERRNHFLYLDGSLRRADGLESGAQGKALRYLSVSGLDAPAVIRQWQRDGGKDVDVGTVLRAQNLEVSRDLLSIIEGSYQGLNAADLSELSAYSLLEANYTGDGDKDYRIDNGYSVWLDALARDIPVRFECPVKLVRWSERGAEVLINQDQRYFGHRLVLAVPLAMLQQQFPRFEPPLPDPQQSALAHLGAGPITKILLRFRKPFWPAELERLSTPLTARFWWRPGWGRPDEEPVLVAYLGGTSARRINDLGPAAAIELALADLRTVFDADQTKNLVDSRFVDWSSEPFTRMGYSFVRPGGVGARSQLATPTGNVLFWAGEATHALRPATVHGAIESGLRAADEISALG